MASTYTDRVNLRTNSYADPGNLTARTSIYVYQRPHHDLPRHVVEMLRDVDGPVIDAGCGPGRYAAALRADRPDRTVIAADLSLGMAAAASAADGDVRACVADITALPFATASAGAVLALHMLYHVPEPLAALAEMKRVCRPGGITLISTNATGDKAELRDLRLTTATTAGTRLAAEDFMSRFNLDTAEEMVRTVFADVERVDLHSELVVTDPEPVMAYLESTIDWYPPDSEAARERAHDAARAQVIARIAAEGAFRARTHVGFLVCR